MQVAFVRRFGRGMVAVVSLGAAEAGSGACAAAERRAQALRPHAAPLAAQAEALLARRRRAHRRARRVRRARLHTYRVLCNDYYSHQQKPICIILKKNPLFHSYRC